MSQATLVIKLKQYETLDFMYGDYTTYIKDEIHTFIIRVEAGYVIMSLDEKKGILYLPGGDTVNCCDIFDLNIYIDSNSLKCRFSSAKEINLKNVNRCSYPGDRYIYGYEYEKSSFNAGFYKEWYFTK